MPDEDEFFHTSFLMSRRFGFALPTKDFVQHDLREDHPIVAALRDSAAVSRIADRLGTPMWQRSKLTQVRRDGMEHEIVVAPISVGKRRARVIGAGALDENRLGVPMTVEVASRTIGGWTVDFLLDDGRKYISGVIAEDAVEEVDVVNDFFGPGTVAGKCVDDCIVEMVESWYTALCAGLGPEALAACLTGIWTHCRGKCGWDD